MDSTRDRKKSTKDRKKIYMGIFVLLIAVAALFKIMVYFLGQPKAVLPQPGLSTPSDTRRASTPPRMYVPTPPRVSVPIPPRVSVPISPRVPQPAQDPSFLILEKEGTDSVLYSSVSGIKNEVYRDTFDIVNPTSIDAGFAFCKKDEDGRNAVYTKLFASSDPPIKLGGIIPLNCLFTIDIKRDIDQIEQNIYYIVKESNGFYVVNCVDITNEFAPIYNIFYRDASIVSRPVMINYKDFVYVAYNPEDLTGTHKLVRHNATSGFFKCVCEADHPFDFITAKKGAVIAVYEPDSDNIKIFRDFKTETLRTFTTINDTIKKIIFSSSGDSIYCLICSKTQADECKVIEVSLEGDEPERTRDLILNIEPDADIALTR